MNERIRQLADEALQLVADEHTNGDESRLNTDSYHVKDLIQSKFAELIIRECAKISLECGINLNREDFRQGIARNIKQHFGVEQ